MQSPRRHREKNRRGFTLVEVSISSVLAGFLLVASLSSAASSIRGQYRVSDRVTGQFLANGLVWEILSLDYMEAGLTSSAITRETGELSTTRVLYDDIDDYNGWSASPPQKKDGTAMTGYSGWQQSVAVAWVNVDNLSSVSASETNVKRITVTISKSGVVMATRIAVKTLVP